MSANSLSNCSDDEIDRRPVTTEEVADSLSVLSLNTDELIVYGQSNLSSLGLTSIGVLSTYKHLQRLLLDNNALVSLSPLRELKFLVYVSAQNNRLDEKVFEDLASSGSTLEHLQLRNNCLKSLSGIRHLPFLLHLFAEENEITELGPGDFSKNHSLTRLHLEFNSIERIHLDTFLHSKSLRSLNLSKNAISNTDFLLHVLPSLETLDLEYNKIEKLDGFQRNSELVRLYLGHNLISDWKELRSLGCLTALCELSLERNPILRGEPAKSSPSNSWETESESRVAQDVQFMATSDSGLMLSGTSFANTFLSTMVPPSAKRFVQPMAAALYEMDAWEDDSQAEMAMLSTAEINRLHVIGAIPQLLCLDGAKVEADDLMRAARLCGDARNKVFAPGKVCLPAGSPFKVVEWRNSK